MNSTPLPDDTRAAATPPPPADRLSEPERAEARRYGRQQLACDLFDRLLDLTYLAIIAFCFAPWLDDRLKSFAVLQSPTARLAVLFILITLLHILVSCPLSCYAGHVLEHRYQLSRQTFGAWLWRYLKVNLLTLVLGCVLALGLYWLIRWTGASWWLWAAAAYFVVVVLLGQLAPVLILPLLHKIEPLNDDALTSRLQQVSQGTGLSIEGVYRMLMSEETVKANAYLAGLGATRRVILGDTLLSGFTPEEIEVVFAHEIGHHVHRHTLKLIVAGVLLSPAIFFVADRCVSLWVTHLEGSLDYRSLPVYAMPFLLLVVHVLSQVVEPLHHALSRHFERQADRYALARTGYVEAYRSFFTKLARLNKADPDPPAWEVWLLHSHPPISERAALADRV